MPTNQIIGSWAEGSIQAVLLLFGKPMPSGFAKRILTGVLIPTNLAPHLFSFFSKVLHSRLTEFAPPNNSSPRTHRPEAKRVSEL